MSAIKLSLIAARSRNGVIGLDGYLPWRLADDLAFFKSATLGHPILMGRNTWESLPKKPLPDRDNIVLTRNWAYQAPGARVFTALSPALEAGKALARSAGKQQFFVIGGESLYAATLPRADFLYLTEVQTELEGDAFFPKFKAAEFDVVMEKRVSQSRANEYPFIIRVLKRKQA